MAVRTIECTECGTTVPYGRLSCPSCGELLASVAGSARRLTSITPTEPELVAEVALAAATSPSEAGTLEIDAAPAPEPVAPAHRPVPPVLHEVETEGAVAGQGWERGWDAADDARDVGADAGDLGSLTWPTVPTDPATASGVDVASQTRSSAPVWTTPPFPPQPSITVAPPAPTPRETPGAYVPPAPVAAATPLAGEVIPAGRPAPARSWAGSANAEPGLSPAATSDGSATRRGAELSLTDPARRAEAIDWIAVAGAALASVGFLLPWARTIIGAGGVGYLDSWGFAGPGHVLVVVGMLVVLALAVAETRIPAWVRLGIPGLVLSALLVGLLWPYILGPLGPLPGAYLSLAGALVLGAAAVAALALDRHARPHPSV